MSRSSGGFFKVSTEFLSVKPISGQTLASARNENAAGASISDSGVWILDAKIGFGLRTVEFSTTQRHGKLETVLSARIGHAVGTHTMTRRSALLSSNAVADRGGRVGVDARDQ